MARLGDFSSNPEEIAPASKERAGRTARPIGAAASAASVRSKMAHLDEDSSNTLFESLADWERHLASIDLEGLGCDDGPDFKP